MALKKWHRKHQHMLNNHNSLKQHGQVCHSAKQLRKNNISTAILLEMKLSLTSVYTQQKSYQTSNQLKTIFKLNLNTNKFKYKHFDKFSHTMSHKATNLPISMGC